MGALIIELRDANLAQKRVRADKPAKGDAQGPASWRRFVVLTALGYTRWRKGRLPLQRVRVGVRCYAATEQDAADLYGELSDLLDNRGPRLSAAGVAIYQSLDEVGGEVERDPDTDQPYATGVIELLAGTEVLGS